MINDRMLALGNEPSAIRELFAYGLQRKAEIGEENVFDFSLGNPSIPAPDAVRQAIVDALAEPACALHGYTPAQGTPAVRQAVADSIQRRHGLEASPNRIYMTAGAAAGLAICLAAITHPGDEVIVIAPYFPEYKVFIESAGCTCVEVPARAADFQPDVPAIAHAITERTSAVIIDSPNNPTGAVYSREALEELAAALKEKEAQFGTQIYLISDEPYREIVYGAEVPWVPQIYARTIVCYSYSKSLSLPGERIGWLYASDQMEKPEGDSVYAAMCGAGRALGFVCAPALFQRVIERCLDEPSDVEAYAVNRQLLTEGLSELGYEYIEPQGAFYLWVRALEPDAQAFAERAKAHELLLVPSDSFGAKGWVRIGYCVDASVIRNSMPAFKALAEEYRS
ncbi:MAG TPA: pyridoxal phosphate-dependent aminotransferase [Candidatus Aphodovivens excrementavium]|nr:pyridoxal phosphate-dependent aminotransferase [Candidatus Aphodovivens excrementavium]